MSNNSGEILSDSFNMNKIEVLPTFATLCSGSGSNFEAILKAIVKGELSAKPLAVISNNPQAKALEIGKSFGVEPIILDQSSTTESNISLELALEKISPDFIVLAGYIKLVPPNLIKKYLGRILNIHPSLLPKYGGKGMYGMRVHKKVISDGEYVSGATVHLVTEEYDQGPIIAQEQVPVTSDDSPETLAAKILKVEHKLYPQAIKQFIKINFTAA